MLWTSIFSLIIITSVFDTIALLNTAEISNKNYILLMTFYSLPPFILVAVMIQAFIRLRGSGGQYFSLSKKQILIQIIAYVSFAISNLLQNFKHEKPIVWYIKRGLDFISLLVLILTLCLIADI